MFMIALMNSLPEKDAESKRFVFSHSMEIYEVIFRSTDYKGIKSLVKPILKRHEIHEVEIQDVDTRLLFELAMHVNEDNALIKAKEILEILSGTRPSEPLERPFIPLIKDGKYCLWKTYSGLFRLAHPENSRVKDGASLQELYGYFPHERFGIEKKIEFDLFKEWNIKYADYVYIDIPENRRRIKQNELKQFFESKKKPHELLNAKTTRLDREAGRENSKNEIHALILAKKLIRPVIPKEKNDVILIIDYLFAIIAEYIYTNKATIYEIEETMIMLGMRLKYRKNKNTIPYYETNWQKMSHELNSYRYDGFKSYSISSIALLFSFYATLQEELETKYKYRFDYEYIEDCIEYIHQHLDNWGVLEKMIEADCWLE